MGQVPWRPKLCASGMGHKGRDSKCRNRSTNLVGGSTIRGGITFNERDDEATIGLSLGADAESHITHSISQPVKIAFEDGSLEHGGILDIEDEAGSKTLVSFIRPYPISKVCENTDMIHVS